ncbi:class I SAM-dependent methyltransferase [Mycobacterium sp. ML4]
MSWRYKLFWFMYQVGVAPWDGHPLAISLRELVEGDDTSSRLVTGTALDIGCGTGDSAIYLARHGWEVTGVDFVSAALRKARTKAAAAHVSVRFVQADVTRLRGAGVGGGFTLIVDSGCMHGMSDSERDAYVCELTAVAAPDARLLIIAMPRGSSFGVRGIDQDEIEQLLAADWKLLSAADEPGDSQPARHYLLQHRR